MTQDLESIVEIDRINMSPILEEAGNKFSFDRRLKALKKELEEGAVIVTDNDNDMLSGYAQYLPKGNGEVYIVSIQVLPKYRDGVALRRQLNKLKKDFAAKNIFAVTSSVHETTKSQCAYIRC